MIELCLHYNPSYYDLTTLHDSLVQYVGQKIKIFFKNGDYLIICRKYTYSGNKVVKTNFLHGLLCFPSGKEKAVIKQTKTGFRFSSYYK